MTTPITQTTASPASGASVTNNQITDPTANRNMFLSMLVAQMKNQDPMQPTDNTQWVAQMAQFSEVEQVSNMAQSENKVAAALSVSQTESLIGRNVTYTDQNGNAQSGTVSKVDIAGGAATLEVGGQTGIDPTTVTAVR